MGLFHICFGWNLQNLSAKSSSLVSTSLAYSGNDEDSRDSGIVLLFFWLESSESSRRTQLQNQNACVLHCLVERRSRVLCRRVMRGSGIQAKHGSNAWNFVGATYFFMVASIATPADTEGQRAKRKNMMTHVLHHQGGSRPQDLRCANHELEAAVGRGR